jgi:hypothetical protein
MSWQVEITSIVRQLIGDAVAPYTFSDSRLQGTIVVAAQLVNQEVAFLNTYTIDIPNSVSFRTACLIDGSTFRTKAAQAGISVKTGSHSISTGGQLDGYKYLLEHGPCKVYAEAKWEYETSNSNAGRAILGPFAGINFDSSYPWGPTDGHTKRYF